MKKNEKKLKKIKKKAKLLNEVSFFFFVLFFSAKGYGYISRYNQGLFCV